MTNALDDAPLMCEAPEDCLLGPEPHPFVAPDQAVLCCVRQSWEEVPGDGG